ncbi:MAG: hypothetical protein AB1898_02705 [Acidobacteriota bacterium]
MEISHLSAVLIFSLSVSIVFALTSKETLREQVQYGVLVFFLFLGVALGLGWIMYPFPG